MQQVKERRKSARQITAEYNKGLKEQAKLAKQLQQFSKDDYDFMAWALHYTMTEIEEKRGFTEGEKEQFTRLMFQCTSNGEQPETARIYGLDAGQVIEEIKNRIELEE